MRLCQLCRVARGRHTDQVMHRGQEVREELPAGRLFRRTVPLAVGRESPPTKSLSRRCGATDTCTKIDLIELYGD